MKPLDMIIAVDEEGGFGKDGKIPWHHPEDLKHFQSTTKGSACIMGRKTYHDMYDMIVARKSKSKNGEKKKPVRIKEILPGRECYVISRSIKEVEGATVVNNIRKAVETTEKKNIFVIGGESIYGEALPWTQHIYLTLVKGQFNCDRFFSLKYLQDYFKIDSGKKLSDNLLMIKYIRKRL